MRAPDDLRDEVDLAQRAFGECEVGGGILQKHLPADRLLHLVDMVGDAGERFFRVGNGQKIVQVGRVVRRPGEVLRKQSRLVTLVQRLQPVQMLSVERAVRADRETDAVQRDRIELADGFEVTVRRAARAHVVLGVDLEEADVGLPSRIAR